MTGKRGRAGGKGQRQREQYRRNLSSADASATATTGYIRPERTTDSTSAGPSRSMPLGPPPPAPARRRRGGWPGWPAITTITLLLTAFGVFGWVIIYVQDVKTTVAKHDVALQDLKEQHASLASDLRTQVQRLETAIERRWSDMVDRLKGLSGGREGSPKNQQPRDR